MLNHSPRWRQCPEYPLSTDWDQWLCHLDFFSNHFFFAAALDEIRVVRGGLSAFGVCVISFLINLLCTTAVHCNPEGVYEFRIYGKVL